MEYLIFGVAIFGCAYTSYNIGRKQGIKDYIDYCHTEARKHKGFLLMHFFGNDVKFLDPMEISRQVIDNLGKAADNATKSREI